MKKFNLIERLFMDSHEKQKVRGMRRYAAMLLLLFMCVTHAWATPTEGSTWRSTSSASNAHVYFDNTNSSYPYVSMLIGRQWDYGGESNPVGSWGVNFSLVSGTNNLYYKNVQENKYTTFCFINQTNWGWEKGNTVTSRLGWCTNTDTPNDDLGTSTHLYVPASGEDNASVTHTTPASYTALNYTQTLYQCVSENGGTAAKSTATIATIGITTKKLNGNSSTTNDNGNISSGSNKVEKSAARTATVTMSVSSIDGDYAWSGWYDAESGGNLLEDDETYTYQATAAKTVYARFSHETNHSVTISRYCTSTSSEISSTSQNVGEVTYASITAPTIAGYNFVNWSLGSGLSKHSSDALTSNPIRVITNSSGSGYTLTANYTEDLTSTWHIIGEPNTVIPNGWTANDDNMLAKATGHSTDDEGSLTINVKSIPANNSDYQFKVYNDNTDTPYGWSNSDYYYMNRDATKTTNVYSADSHPLYFIPDALGDYTFSVDWSGTYPELTVTFPATTYTVNFGQGAGTAGTASATYSSTSFNSGTKVQNGKTIRLTAPSALDGKYNWDGWYNASSGGTRVSTSNPYDATVSSTNYNFYARYTEITHTVTLANGGHGHVEIGGATVTSVANIGYATASGTITAVADPGYYFVNWTGDINNGVTLASGTATSSSITINATADSKTITANFAPIWRITGGDAALTDPDDAMGEWSEEANQITTITTTAGVMTSGTVDIDLDANTEYEFKVYNKPDNHYWGHSGAVTKITYTNQATAQSLADNTGSNQTFRSAGAGTYTFTWDKANNKISIAYPTSYQITIGTVTNTGASKGSVTATGDDDSSLATGDYVAKGSATFTASDVDGYRFIDWRSSSTYGGGSQLSTTKSDYEMSSISADKIVYANYAENRCTVTIKANDKTKGSITVAGEDFDWDGTVDVGVTTTKALVVTPAAGYYFSGWTLSDAPDFGVEDDGESGSSTNLRGLGGTHGSTGTLTANFEELDKIFFRNENETTGEKLWDEDNIYVYYNVSGFTAIGSAEAGVNPSAGNFAQMAPISSGSKIYWAYVPRAITVSPNGKIAFSNQWMGSTYPDGLYKTFYQKEGVYRTDYNTNLNMYVPKSTSSGTSNKTKYYDNGFWMKYETSAGDGASYYLKANTESGHLAEFKVSAANGTSIVATYRIDGTSDRTFYVASAGGTFYKASATISAGACTDVNFVDDGNSSSATGFTVTPSSEGDYTFTIDQSGEAMKITVEYPASEGDYRLKHTYNSGAKTTYSDIIKAGNASTTRTLSMFLSSTGSPTLVLQKYVKTAGVLNWNSGDATNLSGVLSTVGTGGDGVYQFDVSVSADKVASAPTATLYDGPFYIKTDCAPGGWADYKSNEMTKNTINPSGFDYYFVKYVGGSTNVKCVVANDYCNQLSDTLKSDDILGGASDALPEGKAASVRFSYKSSTNALARAYISSSGDLKLIPNAASTVYDTTKVVSDLYGQDNGFSDDQNFTYYRYVKAVQGSQAGVKTTYNSHLQTFFENTNTLIGGSGSTKYLIRLVYDFKTNYITAAWTPDPESPINEALSNIDVMLIREGQEAGTTITFGDKGSLTPQKLIGSLKFDYDDLYGKVSSWTETTRPKMMFFVSFPFDVKVSDLFGLNGNYGEAFIIRRYAGEKRAEKGFFRGDGTTTFWENLTTDSIMHAYEGYIVVLNNYYFNGTKGSIWFGKGAGSSVYLYFPSMQAGTISQTTKTITVPAHECKIDRTWHDDTLDKDLNHKNTDSHWNLIGVPVFTNETGSASEGTIGAVLATGAGADDAFNYYYKWNSGSNDFSINTARGETFGAMHGYMVQYKGDITFTGSVFAPAALAARRAPITENYNIELQVLDNNEEMVNHTYVELRENAHADFELNEDVYLSPNSHDAEIYSFAGDYDVAANVLPIENQSVQLGLNVHKAGTYTISMPSNFSGTATLIDTYNNTRTNLAIEDYEVELTEGAENERFILDINIHKVTTAIDGTTGDGNLKDGKAHKFMENGVMYILQNGRIYNAEGALVK